MSYYLYDIIAHFTVELQSFPEFYHYHIL